MQIEFLYPKYAGKDVLHSCFDACRWTSCVVRTLMYVRLAWRDVLEIERQIAYFYIIKKMEN